LAPNVDSIVRRSEVSPFPLARMTAPARSSCASRTAVAPLSTAEAIRLIDLLLTSQTARTPAQLVSNGLPATSGGAPVPLTLTDQHVALARGVSVADWVHEEPASACSTHR
jgi:hypothetical protein